MSDPNVSEPGQADASRDEMLSALFAQMIIQQSNLALMLLGKVPHPQSGKTMRDIEAARMFIDQLEMLEAKTRGNLSKEEDQLLKHSLMSLRLAFVEAVNSAPTPPPPTPSPDAATSAAPPADSGAADEESKKKFSKKY